MERYTIEDIRAAREEMIRFRDEALVQACFQEAVTLSHVIAMLAQLVNDEERLSDTHAEPAFVPAFTPFDTEGRD